MSKYRIVQSNHFKKDVKLAIKKGYNISLLTVVVDALAKGEVLQPKYMDHSLSGSFQGCRECYITPDWLLIYEIDGDELFLYLTRTGMHSVLF